MHRRSSVSTTTFMPSLPVAPQERESDGGGWGKGSRLGRRKSLKPARHKDAFLQVASWQAFEQVALQANHSQRRSAAAKDEAEDWPDEQLLMAPALRAALRVHATTQLLGTWASPIPFSQNHRFVYRITFENVGDVPIQVLGRRWRFTDEQGVHVVNVGSPLQPAPGVIGAQPVVAPGQACEYYSQYASYSGQGHMEGGFYCRALTEAEAKPARKANPNRMKPADEAPLGDAATHFWAQVAPARLDASEDFDPMASAQAPGAPAADADGQPLDASARWLRAEVVKQLKRMHVHGEGKAFQLELGPVPALTKEHLVRLVQEVSQRRLSMASSVDDLGGMPAGARELLVRLMQGLGEGFTISTSKDADDDDVTQVTVFIDGGDGDGDDGTEHDDSDSDEEDDDLR